MLDYFYLLMLFIQGACALALAVYALHEGVLLALYLFTKATSQRIGLISNTLFQPDCENDRAADVISHESFAEKTVTVQVPLYNERYVVKRIISAISALDYPHNKLEIQILDDSTDDTQQLAHDAIVMAQSKGINIQYIKRDQRVGFKAGALAHGLCLAKGEFVAIFDADFVPEPQFLRQAMPYFADERVGFVQTRWTFLNREQNAITRAQALMLDMHFVIEQPARSTVKLLMNFNGSGGIWRRACIDDAGGWQTDTLTEDLDLSYRAGIKGWRGAYVGNIFAPNELPHNMSAFKQQQMRWSRGTAQCIRKLLPHLLASPVSLLRKLAGALHISGYIIHLFLVAIIVVSPIVAIIHSSGLLSVTTSLPAWFSLTNMLGALPLVLMFVAHMVQGRTIWRFIRDIPFAAICGIGLSFAEAVSFTRGWVSGHTSEFVRTPKNGDRDGSFSTTHNHSAPNKPFDYRVNRNWTWYVEWGLCIYSLVMTSLLLGQGGVFTAMPTMVYAVSFGYVAYRQWLENSALA